MKNLKGLHNFESVPIVGQAPASSTFSIGGSDLVQILGIGSSLLVTLGLAAIVWAGGKMSSLAQTIGNLDTNLKLLNQKLETTTENSEKLKLIIDSLDSSIQVQIDVLNHKSTILFNNSVQLLKDRAINNAQLEDIQNFLESVDVTYMKDNEQVRHKYKKRTPSISTIELEELKMYIANYAKNSNV